MTARQFEIAKPFLNLGVNPTQLARRFGEKPSVMQRAAAAPNYEAFRKNKKTAEEMFSDLFGGL